MNTLLLCIPFLVFSQAPLVAAFEIPLRTTVEPSAPFPPTTSTIQTPASQWTMDLLLPNQHQNGIISSFVSSSLDTTTTSMDHCNSLWIAANEWTNAALPNGLGQQMMGGLGSVGNVLSTAAFGLVALILLSPLLVWAAFQLFIFVLGNLYPEITQNYKEQDEKLGIDRNAVETLMESESEEADDEIFEIFKQKAGCFYEHWLLPVVQEMDPELYTEYQQKLAPGETFVTNLECGLLLCCDALKLDLEGGNEAYIKEVLESFDDDDDDDDDNDESEEEEDGDADTMEKTNDSDVIQQMRKQLEKESKSNGT